MDYRAQAAIAGELSAFGRTLQPKSGRVADAITDRIWKEIPAYAALGDTSEKLRVSEAAARNVAAFLAALVEGRELSDEQIEALGEVGESRASQSIPLEDVLRAFRMVGTVLWEHLGRHLGRQPAPSMQVAVELGEILMRFTDRLSSSVAQHYLNALGKIVRSQEAARREFLQGLLVAGYSSEESIVQRARSLGYDLVRSYFGLAGLRSGEADPAGAEAAVSKALDRLAEIIPTEGNPIVGTRAELTIGLFPASAGSAAKGQHLARLVISELGDDWMLGIGGPYPGLEGCRRSYLEATQALEIGSTVDPKRKVYAFEDLLVYQFLRADSDLAGRFLNTVLGPVIEHDRRRRSELINSLEAYFANDESAKETGRKMFAHPHTITYRLKQIEKLTGRSLKDPEDKLHLQLAVKVLRITAPR